MEGLGQSAVDLRNHCGGGRAQLGALRAEHSDRPPRAARGDLETTRATLNREFKAALVGIRQMSDQVKEADRAYDEDVRVPAADIHGQAERLDHMLERML